MVSSRLAWAKQQDPVSKHQKRKERKWKIELLSYNSAILLLFFCLLVGLFCSTGVWTQGLALASRHSATSAMPPPALFCFFNTTGYWPSGNEICIPVFLRALLTTVKKWKQPKCPSLMDACLKKSVVNVHNVRLCGHKENDVLSFVEHWWNWKTLC
jgi:hypothetical protein